VGAPRKRGLPRVDKHADAFPGLTWEIEVNHIALVDPKTNDFTPLWSRGILCIRVWENSLL